MYAPEKRNHRSNMKNTKKNKTAPETYTIASTNQVHWILYQNSLCTVYWACLYHICDVLAPSCAPHLRITHRASHHRLIPYHHHYKYRSATTWPGPFDSLHIPSLHIYDTLHITHIYIYIYIRVYFVYTQPDNLAHFVMYFFFLFIYLLLFRSTFESMGME